MNWWETITNWISAFFDKPVVIALSGVFAVVGPVFIFLKKTSFGRKAINKLTNLYNLGLETALKTNEKVKDIEILATEKIESLKADYEEKAEFLKKEYEEKTAVLVSIVNFYEESVFAILEKIPNAKVQEKLNYFKGTYQDKKKEITDTIGEIYQDFNFAVEQKANEIRGEYESKIAFLENQIAQVNLYINELKEEAGNYGEREESEDSNPTQEKIQDDQ